MAARCLASSRILWFGLALLGSALLLHLESSSGFASSPAGNKSKEIQPITSLPFLRCELCSQIVSDGEHRYKCPNLERLTTMQNSTLYSCKSCSARLKLWPADCLAVSQCTKCEEKIVNNGRNLHVCFTCPRTHVSHRQHLCSDHRDVHLQRVVLVDFSKAVETEEFLPSEPVDERERGEVMTRQPSWQQKISSARRVVETNPIKTARQTSMKLKRMTSNSST